MSFKKLTHADSPYTLAADADSIYVTAQDIYLECDTTGGAIVINLPPTTAYPQANPKIKVANVAGAANISLVPDPTNVDLINGSAATLVIAGAHNSAVVQMVNQGTSAVPAGMWQSNPAF